MTSDLSWPVRQPGSMAESSQPTTAATNRADDESPMVVVVESTSKANQQQQHPAAVGESESPASVTRLAQPSQPVRQKKSSFQITSVTVGSRLSNDGGEDSADDLDESHTDDLSSDMLDVSKVTDYEYSSEEAFSSAPAGGSVFAADTAAVQPVVSLFTEPHLPSSSGASNVSVTVVESPNLPLSVVQHPEIQWQNRFRVVKIETSEPFRRGRWLCMDFLDPPPASSAPSELGESSSVGGSGSAGGGAVGGGGAGGGQYGNSGSGNSSGTGSMQHGESLVMDSATAASVPQPQHPTTYIRSATDNFNPISSTVVDATHGVDSTPVYPMSIILQTQQQGNVDFTNTALHMQVRAPPVMRPHVPVGPPITGQEFHHSTSSTVCTDHTRLHGPNGAAVTNVVVPQQPQPPSDFVAAHLVRQVGESSHHHQPQQQQQQQQPLPPVGANQAQSQTLVFQQVPSNQVSSASIAVPATQTNVVHGQPQQQQQPNVTAVTAPMMQAGPVPVAVATSDFGCSSEGQLGLQAQPPPQQPNPTAVSDMVGTSVTGAPDVQISASQSVNQNGGGLPTATATGTATGTTQPSQETPPLNAAPSDAEGDGESLKVLAASLEDGGQGSAADRCHGPPSANLKYSSGASTVAIDNKIEQAMDLVKSHLMFAVREEVDVLKERITELMDRIGQLEYENSVLRANATQETLAKLSSQVPGSSAT